MFPVVWWFSNATVKLLTRLHELWEWFGPTPMPIPAQFESDLNVSAICGQRLTMGRLDFALRSTWPTVSLKGLSLIYLNISWPEWSVVERCLFGCKTSTCLRHAHAHTHKYWLWSFRTSLGGAFNSAWYLVLTGPPHYGIYPELIACRLLPV